MVWSKRGKNSGSRDMARNAFSQSDRSIFRNHILHTNPKKMLFFPKKYQKFYFFIPILKKFNFFIFSKKVQKVFSYKSWKSFSVKKMKNWAPAAKLLAKIINECTFERQKNKKLSTLWRSSSGLTKGLNGTMEPVFW